MFIDVRIVGDWVNVRAPERKNPPAKLSLRWELDRVESNQIMPQACVSRRPNCRTIWDTRWVMDSQQLFSDIHRGRRWSVKSKISLQNCPRNWDDSLSCSIFVYHRPKRERADVNVQCYWTNEATSTFQPMQDRLMQELRKASNSWQVCSLRQLKMQISLRSSSINSMIESLRNGFPQVVSLENF